MRDRLPVIILVLVLIVGAIALFLFLSNQTTPNPDTQPDQTQDDPNQPDSSDDPVDLPAIVPDWYETELSIEEEVTVWETQDEENMTGIFRVGDPVKLIGYNSDNSYCRITDGLITGWLSCDLLDGLPANLTDFE